jgi:hypothetical protein
MSRKLLLVCALTLPVFLMAVVAQSMVFHDLNRQVSAKVASQDQWIEKNKKLLAGVTVLQSPERLENLATGMLALTEIGAAGTVKVRFTPAVTP